MITPDQLQDELILLQHHLDDALKGLREGQAQVVHASLGDLQEIITRLGGFLRPEVASEIDRIAEGLEAL